MTSRVSQGSRATNGRRSRRAQLVAAIAIAIATGAALAVQYEGAAASVPVRYTVLLRGEALAGYEGNLAGYAKAPRVKSGARSGRLDVHSAASTAYVDLLAHRQQDLLREIPSKIGRPIETIGTMQHALNAVIVELTDNEADVVATMAGVERVEREQELKLLTDRGPAFIGAPLIWNGTASSGVASKGEGMVAAVLDTGINWESPAFAAVGPIDGYVHVNPLGAGVYAGLCGATPPNADLGRCNAKLIGMYDFTSSAATRSATDLDGHGSHTASTVTGNTWSAPFGGGTFQISGVAPHANVVAFRVCTGGCSSSASTQSLNAAIALGVVDSVNYSISGGTSPWADSVSVAFRNAVNAGIFVAASAGNDGPDAGSVNHNEPWVETVAASTKDNVVGFRFDLTGPGTPPANTQGLPLRPAAPPVPAASLVNVPIVRSPNFANGSTDGCAAYPAETFKLLPMLPGAAADTIFGDSFDVERAKVGAVAVLNLDPNTTACASGARRTAALSAGAVGVVFVDRDFINLGASGTSWSMLRADWDLVWAQIAANPAAAAASFLLPAASYAQRGDVVADFSSRGPLASSGQFVIKPDITAPGVDILAAYTATLGGATATAMENGTSMSGPHIAGAATLLRAVRPTWTPTQVRSAINLTAKTTGLIKANGNAVDAWDLGSGRVDLSKAAMSGLLLDETNANFVAANPASGGNLSTLNLAALAQGACAATCTFTRTVTGAASVSQDYTLSVTGLPAAAATVSPQTFTIAPGASQLITVSVTGSTLAAGWNFGELRLDVGNADLPDLRMPIAIRP